MIELKRRKKTKPAKRRKHPSGHNGGVPCPHCGSPSRVLRTSVGERLRTTRRKPTYVLRERRCISRARHRFQTEEHSR